MGKTYRVAVVAGDGIGPEVVREGTRVLEASQKIHGYRLDLKPYPFGADHYLRTGQMIPDAAFNEIKAMDAVLLGAIGDPRVQTGVLERGIVGRLRFDLDLFVNLRPIKLYAEWLCPLKDKKPEHVDILVVRENTEDAYRSTPEFTDEGVSQKMIYTRAGTERIIRYAFEAARRRPRKKLTLVDKANAIPAHQIYRDTFDRLGKDYPEVTRDVAFIDAACMWLVKNPESFDTIVTTNMFGDILTDLGAQIQGGLGIAAGGNIHPGRVSMFEPIHGSAPKYKGLNKANPLATILAGAMMLEHLGELPAAQHIERVVIELLRSRTIPTLAAEGGLPTDKIGSLVVDALR